MHNAPCKIFHTQHSGTGVMKYTFSQLLEKIDHAKDMPPELYHGTSIFNLYYILQSNELVEGAHWGKPDEPHGPRLTKDPNVARAFFSYATPDLGDNSPGAVIALSTMKLAQYYELVEYNDIQADGDYWDLDEQEVVVVTERIKPLHTFTTSIRISSKDAQAVLTDDVLELAVNWPYLEVESIEQARELMRQTLHHPEVTIV